MTRQGRARRAAYTLGLRAETIAALLLRLKGYRILARRYPAPVGEIDLVALRRRTLVFIEVKARATLDDAAASILPFQRSRIVRGAEAFLSRHPRFSGYDMRFDAVLVAPGHLPRHLEAAFDTQF
ncbi:YraN family protein [Terrihabitans sp. B22-R8]|uniref:YraN family protein n=1 Tax=Terrihabitans sp. B22-R8 TaxID=3425128 RepID=UPI00403C4C08